MALKTVKVPKEMEPLFAKAEKVVSEYFSARKEDPSKGTIEVFGDRYIMVRAASLSVEFFGLCKNLFGEGREEEARIFAQNILFDLAHAIGKSDARNFHRKMELKDPIAKLSAGPILFSHSGWAYVDIFPESKPSPDKNYYLIYDHPYSFECEAWIRSGEKPDFPVCIMNAGYSSGWCEESFGIDLVASEFLCRARGDDCCRFIMAPPDRIDEHIKKYIKEKPKLASRIKNYEIPDFFARKRIEETLRVERDRANMYLDIAGVILLVLDTQGKIMLINKKGCDLLGYTNEDIVGKNWFDNFIPEGIREKIRGVAAKLISGDIGSFEYHENPIVTKSGEEKLIAWHNAIFRDEKGNIIGRLSSGEDITERKQIEEAIKENETKFRSITEAAFDSIIMIDNEGRVALWNNAAEKMFSYAPDEIMGKNLHLILAPKHYHEKYKEGFKEFVKTGQGAAVGKTLELEGIRKNGERFSLELSLSAVKIKDKWCAIGIVRDINERKDAEYMLKKYQDNLEDLVMERIVEVKRTRDKLEREVETHKKSAQEYESRIEQLSDEIERLKGARK